jgi:hypothetical protein
MQSKYKMMVKHIFVIFLIGINMDLDSQADKSFETRRLKTTTSQEEKKTFTGDYSCQENQIMLKLSTDA